MFNQLQKTRFIEEYTASISSRKKAAVLFERFAPIEEAKGTDIITFDDRDLTAALETVLVGYRRGSLSSPMRLLKQYYQWCVDNFVTGVSDAITRVTPDFQEVEQMSRSSVRNPAHLNVLLDRVFDPEEYGTADEILRGYLWAAFIGIPEDLTEILTEGDVDPNGMSVLAGGVLYPTYREGIQSLLFCRNATVIRRLHPLGGHGVTYIDKPRAPGNLLFRTSGDGMVDMVGHLRTRVAKRVGSARERGIIDVRLAYNRVRMSGQFYRAYEMENAGLEPNIHDIEVANRKPDTDYTEKAATVRRSEIKRDYNIWKKTLV